MNLLTCSPCPVRYGPQRPPLLTCSDHTCKVTIDQDEDGEKNYCYIGATRSWNGYGPWMCCNHALIAGWPEYDREACNHCLYRRAQVNPHTGLPKIVKGVPERVMRPTGGWTHGKGKARKRLLLHSKRLQTQTLTNPALGNRSPAARSPNRSAMDEDHADLR